MVNVCVGPSGGMEWKIGNETKTKRGLFVVPWGSFREAGGRKCTRVSLKVRSALWSPPWMLQSQHNTYSQNAGHHSPVGGDIPCVAGFPAWSP